MYSDWLKDEQRFDCFYACLTAYETLHISGGSLHIYLEDGNNDLDDIEFCLKWATEQEDWLGVYLCKELLYYGEQFIKELVNVDVLVAFDSWRRARQRELEKGIA